MAKSGAGRPSRLGRGLSSLMSQPAAVSVAADTPAEAVGRPADSESADQGEQIARLGLDELTPNPSQPRRSFDADSLGRLADSIRSTGVMQPVIVRAAPSGTGYEIVAGERRWRAAQQVGLEAIPAIVRKLDDRQTSEWALIENLQREDLNPIDRAQAFQSLIDRYQLNQEQIAERVGVDRSTISNTMRLLVLDDQVQEVVRLGHLSISQAKVLLSLSDPAAQRAVARKAVTEQWPVRRLESEVTRINGGGVTDAKGGSKQEQARPPHLEQLEQQIRQELGTKVRLKQGRKKGSGSLTIDFYSLDQFDGLMERLGVEIEGA